jgi:hypothetical protein
MHELRPARRDPAPEEPDTRPAAPARAAAPPPVANRRVSADDALGATLARTVRARPTRPLLQRVGETKLGHEAIHSAATSDARDAWVAALEELRTNRKARKSQWEANLKHWAATEGIEQHTIMDRYPDALTMDADVIAALQQTEPFDDGTLTLDPVDTDDDEIRYVVRDASNNEPLATVALGSAAFLKGKPTAGGRATFTRNGKEYVADNRGVPTRRHAYVEKNVFQLMDLLATGSMTGRYQMLHTALKIQSSIYDAGETLGREVTGGTFARGQKLTATQLAVLHQWKGSGQDQRGLSLTSTPRAEAVYSNRGDSFRSTGGVRIEIDLFMVPKDVLLLNHYAAGGVSSALGDVNPALNSPSKYSYENSVIKNRELFLEKLSYRWISGVVGHFEDGDKPAPSLTGDALMKALSLKFAYAAYGAGFTAGCLNQELAADAAPMFELGHGVGAEYTAGYFAGRRAYPVRTQVQQPPTPRGKHGGGRSAPPKPRPHQGASFGDLKTTAHDDADKHLIYWIGWAHGSWDRPRATTLAAALA